MDQEDRKQELDCSEDKLKGRQYFTFSLFSENSDLKLPHKHKFRLWKFKYFERCVFFKISSEDYTQCSKNANC